MAVMKFYPPSIMSILLLTSIVKSGNGNDFNWIDVNKEQCCKTNAIGKLQKTEGIGFSRGIGMHEEPDMV